jgi:methionyl-tRNA synthetase
VYAGTSGTPTIFDRYHDSQTHAGIALRLGTTPEELARTSTELIREALSAIGISVDGFGPFDETYRETVLNFFRTLHAKGTFELRTVKLPYRARTGEFAVEGLVEGDCPVCLSTSRGGLCETCCHPNNYNELLDPHPRSARTRPTGSPSEARILVLPLELPRAAHRLREVDAVLAAAPEQMIRSAGRPLPGPITYP